MNWNYRITKEKLPTDDYYFSIREVYYNENGIPESYSSEASRIDGYYNEENLRENLTLILQSLDSPILNVEDIGK